MTTKEEITLYTAEQSLRRRESQFINLCVLNFMFLIVFTSFIYLVNQQTNAQLINQSLPAQSDSLMVYRDLKRLAEQPIIPTVEQTAIIPLPAMVQASDPLPQVIPNNFPIVRWQKSKAIRSRWLFKRKTASLKHLAQVRQQVRYTPAVDTNFIQDDEPKHKKKLIWNTAKGDFELEK